jgi:hypothetical protein
MMAPVESDPERQIAPVNCRIAKGSLDRLVSDGD